MTNKTAEAVTQQLFVCSPVTVCAPRSFSSNSLTRSNNSTSSSVHFQNSLLFLDVLLLRHFRAPESKAADEPHACAVRDVSVRMNSCSTENNSVDVATVRLCSSTHAGSSPAFVQRRGYDWSCMDMKLRGAELCMGSLRGFTSPDTVKTNHTT